MIIIFKHAVYREATGTLAPKDALNYLERNLNHAAASPSSDQQPQEEAQYLYSSQPNTEVRKKSNMVDPKVRLLFTYELFFNY